MQMYVLLKVIGKKLEKNLNFLFASSQPPTKNAGSGSENQWYGYTGEKATKTFFTAYVHAVLRIQIRNYW